MLMAPGSCPSTWFLFIFLEQKLSSHNILPTTLKSHKKSCDCSYNNPPQYDVRSPGSLPQALLEGQQVSTSGLWYRIQNPYLPSIHKHPQEISSQVDLCKLMNEFNVLHHSQLVVGPKDEKVTRAQTLSSLLRGSLGQANRRYLENQNIVNMERVQIWEIQKKLGRRTL